MLLATWKLQLVDVHHFMSLLIGILSFCCSYVYYLQYLNKIYVKYEVTMFVTLEDLSYVIILLEFRLTFLQQNNNTVGFCLLKWPFPASFMQILQGLHYP